MDRLTNKDLIFEGGRSNCKTLFDKVYRKLGQLEDLMEKYNVNELWELEMILDYYEHRYDDVQTRRKE